MHDSIEFQSKMREACYLQLAFRSIISGPLINSNSLHLAFFVLRSSLTSFWPVVVSFFVRNSSYLFVNSSLARIQSQIESSLHEERIREEQVKIAKMESFMSCLLIEFLLNILCRTHHVMKE